MKRHSRLTVREQVYYAIKDRQPFCEPSGFGIDMLTDEQPYQRVKLASETWEQLDCGWITSASALVLKNDGPTTTLLLGCSSGVGVLEFARLGPKESLRFRPADLHVLVVRCVSQPAPKYTVTLFPGD